MNGPVRNLTRGYWVRLCALTLVGIAVFFLLAEHGTHVLGALPYLLFLACPLMHLFMHDRHRHHGNASDAVPGNQPDYKTEDPTDA